MSIMEFFNSNFFVALVTFIVGGFAIVLYLKQKKDYRKDAARLILQEIRYAEQQIRNARIMGASYYLASKLLPTNSWHKNIHLFTQDLKETEIDMISRFYSHASYLDTVIKIISDYKNKGRRIIRQSAPSQSFSQQSTGPSLPSPAQQVVQSPEEVVVGPLNAIGILKNVSQKIEFLYNTPVLDRLKRITEEKWYSLF